MYRGLPPWRGLGVYAKKFSTVGFYPFVVEEVWCSLGEAGGWRVTLRRFNAAELGSRQDKALKPWVVLTKASHYLRLMLPEWAQSECKNSHIRTYLGSSPSRCTFGLYGMYFARLEP